MKLTTKLISTAALLLTATTAAAHTGHGTGGFTSGLLHPMLGLDHLLAMAAIGFWSVRQSKHMKNATPAFVIGGTANPLYSLLIAYLNDYLQPEDMAAASGGLMFVNGVGAIAGPLVTGWLMGSFGSHAFWLFVATLMLILTGYSLYRMTQRAATPVDETAAYVSVMPTASPVAVEAAQEWAIEQSEATEEHE